MPASVPPYKPPEKIQELLKLRQQQLQHQQSQQQASQQTNQRRRTAVLPKRSWIQRYPRVFQITAITTSLLIFFSKPLYDAFIATPLPPPEVRVPPHRR